MAMALGVRASSGTVLVGVLLALACGRVTGGAGGALELGNDPVPPAVSPYEPPSESKAPPEPEVGEPEVTQPDVPRTALGFPGYRLPDDPRRSQLVAMLERACSSCHEGPSDERDRFLDLEILFAGNFLLAGRAESSELVLWLQYGDRKRQHAGVEVRAEELAALIDYVNSFDRVQTCPGYTMVDRDLAQELMLADLSSRDPADRPFLRYVGAVRATPLRGCMGGPPGAGAFLSLMNAVSLRPELIPVEDEVEGGPIFVIDLRDYAWTTPIDIDGPEPKHFEDRWSALVDAAGPYALELQGPAADAVKQQTGAPVPFLPTWVFVANASVGRLYAALVGVGSDVNALGTSLGISAPLRAGIRGKGAMPSRFLTRYEQGTATGSSWWTREELPTSEGSDFPADPVHYTSPGAELIFTLPNGLPAYAIAGADGRRLDELPCTVELACAGPVRALTSVTCRNCHGGGPAMDEDELLPYVDAFPTHFAPDLLPLIRERYGSEQPALEADRERFYNAAYSAVSRSFSGESIVQTYHDFKDHPVDADRAANDLGVQIEQLRAGISALGTAGLDLAPLLTDGKVERELFTTHFEALACAIPGPRHLPARCPPTIP
ncbi:MAG TPA: hypothetical protein VJU61_18600 [Polyangiaceae bacterium]|nr:hypothetical protein [Polyangiaceae bacterium]